MDRKEETPKTFKFNFSVEKKNPTGASSHYQGYLKDLEAVPSSTKPSFLKLHETKEEPKVISNVHPIKVTAPEKRIKLDKSSNLDNAMPPPPPIQKPMQKEEENAVQNDISTIQSEVEKKLEIQKENNRDVMETITVNALK